MEPMVYGGRGILGLSSVFLVPSLRDNFVKLSEAKGLRSGVLGVS